MSFYTVEYGGENGGKTANYILRWVGDGDLNACGKTRIVRQWPDYYKPGTQIVRQIPSYYRLIRDRAGVR